MTTLEHKLKACGIQTDAKTVKLAQDMVQVNNYVDNLDIISLPLSYLRLLRLYPLLVIHKTPESIVKAFYEDYIARDIDCIDSTLGKCISKSMAAKQFLNPRVDISKIPSEQYDLVDFVKKTYIDPITLQQQSLDSLTVVQIRESGEIMTRDTFNDIVNRNVQKWQGKENVGFKSINTIIGNPVLFNYDEEPHGFFRQKPGTLTISRIDNKQKFPSAKGIIPTHYFMLRYFNYTFYLPDTVAGRRVLFMMKDAFKKGNLLAYSDDGYVRNGRVHKKTSLYGGSTKYGYPDDYYLDRVIGELTDLGSSLYTYRHSQDPYFRLSADPYPDEKRFLIDFK